MHPANSSNSNVMMSLLLVMLYLRLFSGALGSLGAGGVAPLTTLAICGVAILSFLTRPTFSGPSFWLVVGLMIWNGVAIISWYINAPLIRPELATTQVALLTTYAFFLNALEIHTKEKTQYARLQKFLHTFIILGFILCIFQIGTGAGFQEHGRSTFKRAFGSDVHPVPFSLQIVIALVGLEIIRLKLNAPFGRKHLMFFAVSMLAMFLTYSRTGWLIFAIVFGSYALLNSKPILKVTVAPIALISIVFLAISSGRFDDLSTIGYFFENYDFESNVYDYRYIDNSLTWRIANWAIGLQSIIQQPWLGFGPGQAVAVSQFNLQMHNLLFEVLIEVGVIGALPMLVVLFSIARTPRILHQDATTNKSLHRLWRLLSFALFLNIMISNSLIGQTMTILLLLIVRVLLIAPIQSQSLGAQKNIRN